MRKFLGVITALILALFLATGCNALFFPSALPDAAANANFRMLLSDEPNAIGDFDTVMVTITGIGLLPAGEDAEWIDIELTEPWEGDLKELLGDNASEVWAGIIPVGNYVKAFIYVENIEATLMDDIAATVKIPSGKLQMSKPFSVTADGGVDFVFDITIIQAGNSGQYIVKPQIGESGPDKEYKEVEKQERKENKETKENNGVGHLERDAKLKGTIDAMNGDTWTVTVGEDSFQVNVADAQIKGEPAVGLGVKINGTEGENDIITATYVHVLVEDDEEENADENEIEFKGPITNLSPLTIAGYTVVTNEATEIKGTPVVGGTAEVEGWVQDNGSVMAKKIDVDDEDDGGPGQHGKPTKEANTHQTTKTNNGRGNDK